MFPGNGKQRWSEGRIAELERKIGQQALDLDFLKGCLQRIEEYNLTQAERVQYGASLEQVALQLRQLSARKAQLRLRIRK